MKTLKNILAITIITITIVTCKNESQPEIKIIETEASLAKTEKVLNPDATFVKSEFTIEGMTCQIGCANTIEKKIAKMNGVKYAKVDFERKLAMVEYDEAVVNHESLEATVSKTADVYKVSDMKTVEDFSTKTNDGAKIIFHEKECTAKCSPDCKEKECSKCATKLAECKKKCEAKKAESKDKA